MKKALVLSKAEGFTLIELMIVIAILGILAALISGQFITSLKKGRDARRKSDLDQTQKALEMYYEDNKAYPDAVTFGSALSTADKTYMQKVSNDPISGNSYQYESDGTYYRLFSCIENGNDQSSGVSQTGYSGGPASCGTGACATCKYTISSPNITPLPIP